MHLQDQPEAYRQGHRAGWQTGASLGDNPYTMRSANWLAWRDGWREAAAARLECDPNPYALTEEFTTC